MLSEPTGNKWTAILGVWCSLCSQLCHARYLGFAVISSDYSRMSVATRVEWALVGTLHGWLTHGPSWGGPRASSPAWGRGDPRRPAPLAYPSGERTAAGFRVR